LKEQLPTILDNAPVALRHPRQRAIFEVSAAALAGYRTTLDRLGFTEIQTPKIVGGATESGANVFERVYETGPVFRAEPHDTPRHLAEYVSLDAEIGFIEDHRTVMGFCREAVVGMLEGVAGRAGTALAQLGIHLPMVPDEIPVLHFADALALIEEGTGEAVTGELDLAPSHERWLGEWALRTYGSEFVFVEGYPMDKRPFYTHPEEGRPEFSASFDLLFRGLELVTGGQRLHRHEDYLRALAERGMSAAPLEGYLQAFRYGMPPHGGFAIGLERFVSRLTGAQNIREATLFPRDLKRLSP